MGRREKRDAALAAEGAHPAHGADRRRAGLATAILTACGGGSSSSNSGTTSAAKAQTSGGGTPAAGIFKASKKYKFVFVNHVTTNPFFVPTRYGAEDACKLLGCSYQWTGSENSNVNEMVNAFNTAITGGADVIAIALVDNKAFNGPTDSALKAKSRWCPTTRTRSRTRACPNRPGPVRLRPGDGQAHRRARALR